MQKFGWFGGLGVTQGYQQHNHLIEHMAYTTSYSTLIETMSLSYIPLSSYCAFFVESGRF